MCFTKPLHLSACKPTSRAKRACVSSIVENIRIYFEGHVQGVGFRYQTAAIAKGFEVTGYVRNCADGRVEIFAEGLMPELEAFSSVIHDELSDYIRTSACEKNSGCRSHEGFSIEDSI